MDNNIWLGIFIALMLLLSAYFSATETAFSSLNKIRIKNMAQIGDKKAQLAMIFTKTTTACCRRY